MRDHRQVPLGAALRWREGDAILGLSDPQLWRERIQALEVDVLRKGLKVLRKILMTPEEMPDWADMTPEEIAEATKAIA